MFHLNELVAIFTLYLDVENLQQSSQEYYDESNRWSTWQHNFDPFEDVYKCALQ